MTPTSVLAASLMSWLIASSAIAGDSAYHFGESRFGAFVVPVPLDIQAQRNLVPGQGVMVVATRPGGTADRMGIQPGDIVVSLNDVSVSTRRDVRGVVQAVQPGDAARAVVVTNDGEDVTVAGTFQPRQPWHGMADWRRLDALPGTVDPSSNPQTQTRDLLELQHALDDALTVAREVAGQLLGNPVDDDPTGILRSHHAWSFIHDFDTPLEHGRTRPDLPVSRVAPVRNVPIEPNNWSFHVAFGSEPRQ